MDYKYIEQLIERYFDCQTTLQEEQILRSFFAQEDVPVRLLQYADLFKYEVETKECSLSADFDRRVMDAIAALEPETEKKSEMGGDSNIHVMKPRSRMIPFYRAAAIVAVVLTIANAADSAFGTAVDETPAVTVNPYMTRDEVANIKGASNSQVASQVSDTLLSTPAEDIQVR